ncbi:hypothetical protein, partial [Plesiomonas shigelloides]
MTQPEGFRVAGKENLVYEFEDTTKGLNRGESMKIWMLDDFAKVEIVGWAQLSHIGWGECYTPSKTIYKEAPSLLLIHTNPKLLSSS